MHGEKEIEARGSKVEESNITQEMAVLHSLISPWKWKGKKEKRVITTEGIRIWTRGLTLLSELNILLSLWYSDYTERFFFNFLDEKRYQKEKKISDNA